MSTDTLLRDPAADQEPPPRPHRWGMVLAVILLAALALTVTGMFPFRQLVDQARQVDQTRARLTELVDENARLEERIADLQTDEELERLAREDYGYVLPGETGYVVVVPPDAGVDPADRTDAAAVEPDPPAPWWVRAWRFVTGGDLADDG